MPAVQSPGGVYDSLWLFEFSHTVLQLRITTVPEPDQWEHVLRYSRRIRKVLSSRRDVCKHTIEMIERHCPGGRLFPNLREARLAGPSCAREISILIQPSLLSVHYEIDPKIPESWRFSSIAERAPTLTALRITDSTRPLPGLDTQDSLFVDPKLCAALSDTVLNLKDLTVVEFKAALSPEAVKHLSELPRLARLALQLTGDNCAALDTTLHSSPPFPSLQSLHVRGRNTTQLASWISCLRSPALTELHVFAEKRSPIEAAQGLLDAISRLRGLTVLRIQFANERYLATDDVFTPLFQKLSSLEEFTVGGLAFNPTSAFLVAVVSAWPRLRNLELQHTSYSKPTSHRIPLRDLLIFAQHCPSIKRIAIPLSPYMYTNPTRHEDGVVVTTHAIPPLARSSSTLAPAVTVPGSATLMRLPPSKLQVLQIPYGFEPEDYQDIAEFLANVFPAAELTFRCPLKMRGVLGDCVRTITGLKEKYLRTR